jgi:hypothetical protein
VKGLQRHRAGGTRRQTSAESGGTYLREWSGSQKGRAEDGRDGVSVVEGKYFGASFLLLLGKSR